MFDGAPFKQPEAKESIRRLPKIDEVDPTPVSNEIVEQFDTVAKRLGLKKPEVQGDLME
jgi:hypothetical protein